MVLSEDHRGNSSCRVNTPFLYNALQWSGADRTLLESVQLHISSLRNLSRLQRLVRDHDRICAFQSTAKNI